MKLRTQFILTLSLFALILIGMVVSLLVTNRQVDRLLQQEEIARRIERGASELNYLSGDYLMYGEPQQRARWESSFASFSADLASLKPASLEQQTIINHMITDQKRLQAVFTDVVSTMEDARTSADAPDPAFNQVSWSRMEVQNRSIAFEAALLSQQLRDEADWLKQMNFLLAFVLISFFGSYLLINYYSIYQRTLKPIVELHAGTEIIGSGNLDYAISVKRADEIGELSRAFNRMTANLKEVTASKVDLEREIAERKQAEEERRKSEEHFRLALTHAPVSVATQDRDLRYTWAYNQRTRRANEIVGKTDLELFPSEAAFLTELKRRVLKTGENIREQLWVTDNDRQLFLDLSIEPLRNEVGEIDGVGLASVDLTQVKRAEEALEKVNEILQAQALEMEMQARELQAQRNELVDANEHLRLSEELANQRLMETQAANKELQSARLAALNLMEDALAAQEKVKQINARLSESEQRLKRAQEIAHLGSWELDLVNDRLTWSDEVYRIFGLQPQAFSATYEAFLAAVHPDDRTAVDAAYSGSVREGRDNYEIEHRIVKHSSGEVRIVQEKCEHFRDENGKIIRSVGMVHDITERKLAEEALRRSEALLSQTGEMAKIGGWELDLQTMIAYWSLETYRIHEAELSLPPNFESAINFYAPEARPVIRQAVQRAVEEGQPYDLELPFITAKGRPIWIRTIGKPEFHDGKCVRLFGAFQDITERKRAEDALREAHDQLELRVQERTMELAIANTELVKEIAERKEIEQQLRLQTTAIEAAANGIVITNAHGNIQWANPAILQISGYEARELIGKSTRIFSSGQHDEGFYHRMWETILSGRVWQGETINRHKDGALYIEEQTITPVRADHERVTHFIAIKQDITERKQAEENLAQRNVELQIISSAERNQRQFSEALIEAAIILNRSLKLSEVLSLIQEQIRGVIPYASANIVFLEGESFYVASHQDDFKWLADPAVIDNRFLVEDFPILSRMHQSGKPVLLLDLKEEPDWITLKGFEWARSFLSAPLLVENKVIGFVNLFGDQPRFFNQEMSDRLVAFAAHAGVAIQNAWLFEQVRASTERLQSLSRRLVEIQENERLYISRELHDEAGQVLTSLLVDLRLLEKNAAQPDAILKIVAEMERSLNGVIENLHRMAMALRPASLDHVGLVAALRQHVEAVGEKHGIQASFRSGAVVERLPANVETVLYRTVQEALTNVIRHAQATRVDVVLTVRDNKLIVLVEDDGVGFDPDDVSSDDHLGLFGIRERTEMIGGALVIESAPGKGTTIMLEVDYANTATSRR